MWLKTENSIPERSPKTREAAPHKESWMRAQVSVLSSPRDINSFHLTTPSDIHFTLPNPQYNLFHSHLPNILFDLTCGMPGPCFLSHFTDSCQFCCMLLSLPTSLWATRSQGSPLSLHDPLLPKLISFSRSFKYHSFLTSSDSTFKI